ncbi:lyase family protein [Cognatiyoonia sp. IB215182]|uniref:lyase family protein n=1 Tax=Cognatiyoonia sp. IB215182 TaxID=3097353 RepID=UPI002A17D6A6|nr:lyase family protein [Cognatiyoonia sp. IB215182]MDX8354000.1 lyase family protein [Cognatiyoonia sp. IB215182]
MIDIATHPWMSGLLGDEEMAATFAPAAELQRLLGIEAAWTRALGEIEGNADAEHIALSIEAAPIDPSDLKAGMAKDGVPIPALVRLLREHVGPDLASHVHTGLTSQDVVDTSLVLALRQVLSLLGTRLDLLDQRLTDQQNTFGYRSMTAYTRMQPAMETSVHVVINRWRQPLSALISDINDAQNKIGIVQWGGPIGVRDHAEADALGVAFARHLGLRDPEKAWHTDRTVLLEVAQLLSRVSIATGKIGEDVALIAVAGTGDIAFKGGGSSAMPHKNNPVKAEALIALADYVATLSATMLRSARHEGFRSGRAWLLEWLTLPQMCVAAGAGTQLAACLVKEVTCIGSTEESERKDQ